MAWFCEVISIDPIGTDSYRVKIEIFSDANPGLRTSRVIEFPMTVSKDEAISAIVQKGKEVAGAAEIANSPLIGAIIPVR